MPGYNFAERKVVLQSMQVLVNRMIKLNTDAAAIFVRDELVDRATNDETMQLLLDAGGPYTNNPSLALELKGLLETANLWTFDT